jgi:hypothetical protein
VNPCRYKPGFFSSSPHCIAPFSFRRPSSIDSLPPSFLTGIRPTSTTPLKFRQPSASSPSPLAPQLEPVQLRPPLRRNFPCPEPPPTGAARAWSSRRQLSPPDPPLHQVYKQLPVDPLMLVRPSVARVRRPIAGNGDAPPRPPHSPVGHSVLLLPVQRPLVL